jgi:outer membrane receptor protein involved in Fe transport
MMKNDLRLSIALLFISFPFWSLAQSPASGQVVGKVIDPTTQQPLDFATATLFALPDSNLIDGAITDESGVFELEVRPGNYYLTVEFVSYQRQHFGPFEISRQKPRQDLGTIRLQPDVATLVEVEVRAEKSQVQLALDKRVFNVGKDLANVGGSAADVLDNVPSVTVDLDGNVSLRGSGGVRILIDGKPSGLAGIGNSDGLRQIPANLIDRIEVITNPSARYEAEGMTGVINIILKKDQRRGINGAFDLTTGHPHNHGLSANLNYRRSWLNLFGNYGFNYRRNPGGGSLYQEFYDRKAGEPDTTYLFQQRQERERGGWGNNLRLGADFFLNAKTTLTASVNYRLYDRENFSEIEYRDFLFSLDNPLDITRRRDDERERGNNLEYNFSYRRQFDDKGHELNADVRYQDNSETERSAISEQYFTPQFFPIDIPDLQQRTFNQEGEKMLIVQVDYVRPLAKDGKFELGYRSSWRSIANDFSVEEFGIGQWDFLPNFTNEFLYQEDVHAVYAIYGQKLGRLSFQAGLRAEYSDVRTELLKTGEVNPRDYLNLFPSGHLNYELPNQNAVQFSYSRRINRPSFWSLNPFFSFNDARNFFAGNPNLDPEFTHSLEFGHIKYWDKASLTSSVYYRYTEGVTERIRTVDANGNFFTRPVNLSTQESWGLEGTFSYALLNWWSIDGNANFFRSVTQGAFEGQVFDAEAISMFGRLNSKMTLWKTIETQARFNYRAPRNTPQGKTRSISHLDLAFSKDILENKGTMTLSINDVFNSRRWRYLSEGPGFFTEGDFQWRRGQIVMLTLNYRLNQQKKQRGRNGEGGGDGGDMGF